MSPGPGDEAEEEQPRPRTPLIRAPTLEEVLDFDEEDDDSGDVDRIIIPEFRATPFFKTLEGWIWLGSFGLIGLYFLGIYILQFLNGGIWYDAIVLGQIAEAAGGGRITGITVAMNHNPDPDDRPPFFIAGAFSFCQSITYLAFFYPLLYRLYYKEGSQLSPAQIANETRRAVVGSIRKQGFKPVEVEVRVEGKIDAFAVYRPEGGTTMVEESAGVVRYRTLKALLRRLKEVKVFIPVKVSLHLELTCGYCGTITINPGPICPVCATPFGLVDLSEDDLSEQDHVLGEEDIDPEQYLEEEFQPFFAALWAAHQLETPLHEALASTLQTHQLVEDRFQVGVLQEDIFVRVFFRPKGRRAPPDIYTILRNELEELVESMGTAHRIHMIVKNVGVEVGEMRDRDREMVEVDGEYIEARRGSGEGKVRQMVVIGKMLSRLEQKAEANKEAAGKRGKLAIFLFVFLPVPGSGELIGGLAGLFMKIPTRVVFLIVGIGGMISSMLIAYTGDLVLQGFGWAGKEYLGWPSDLGAKVGGYLLLSFFIGLILRAAWLGHRERIAREEYEREHDFGRARLREYEELRISLRPPSERDDDDFEYDSEPN